MTRILRYQLPLYYLNALEQPTAQGAPRSRVLCISSSLRADAAARSTMPQGLLALLLASSSKHLLPILLSAVQVTASRRWPDSDIPPDLKQIKVVVNTAATSIVAELKRWNAGRHGSYAYHHEIQQCTYCIELTQNKVRVRYATHRR